jgi:general secretion pathway protein L
MKAGIYIELPSQPNAEPKLARCHGGRLEPLSFATLKTSDRSNAVAFAPALSVARFSVPIAAKSESEARKIALFAIEDDLAQPVEDVHLTLGSRNPGSSARDVFIVDNLLLKSWMETLSGLGLSHAPIVPESSLTFEFAGLLDFGDRILMNGADGIIAADAAWPDEAILELAHACGIQSSDRTPANALDTLVALHAARPGTALSGTTGGHRNSGNPSASKRWRLAGSLTAFAATLWIASIWIETGKLNQTAAQNEVAAHAIFAAQYPNASKPADIHAEARRLAAHQAAAPSSGFRQLTAALYDAISGSDTIRLVSLSYDQQQNGLGAELRFANRPDEAAFRSRLENAGWSVETTNAVDSPSGIEASIIVRPQS